MFCVAIAVKKQFLPLPGSPSAVNIDIFCSPGCVFALISFCLATTELRFAV